MSPRFLYRIIVVAPYLNGGREERLIIAHDHNELRSLIQHDLDRDARLVYSNLLAPLNTSTVIEWDRPADILDARV
jgi:hypothetical protein